MAIFTMLASLSKPVNACSSRNFHCAGLSSAPSTMPRLQVGGLGVLAQDVDEGGDEEACRAARRITDPLAGLRVHQRDDQVDDVARSAELAVGAGHARAC